MTFSRKHFTNLLLNIPFAVAIVLLMRTSVVGFSIAMAFGICAVTTRGLFAMSRGFVSRGWKIFFRSLMLLLMIPLFGMMAFVFLAARSSGDYRCLICGKQIDRVTYFGVAMETNPPDSLYHTGKDYEEWYWRNVAAEHAHDWEAIGCHSDGVGIACNFEGIGPGFYLFIPQIPDQAIAVVMARRIVRCSRDERRDLLHAFPESRRNRKEYPEEMSLEEIVDGGGSPWGRILADKQMTNERFKAYYECWLNHHPEWR